MWQNIPHFRAFVKQHGLKPPYRSPVPASRPTSLCVATTTLKLPQGERHPVLLVKLVKPGLKPPPGVLYLNWTTEVPPRSQ